MPADLFDAARRWESLGRLDKAIDEYARLASEGRGGAEALVCKALLHRERGELAQVMAALEQAEALYPQDPWVKMRLGQVTTSLGRDIVAVSYFREAIRCAPHLEELRINLADVCSRLGWFDLGHRAVRDLPEALPDWWAKARQLAISQYEDRRSETLALLRARKRGTLPHDVIWDLAQQMYSLGRLKVAARLCEQLLQSTPTSFPPFDLMSKIIARADGPAEALSYLRALPPRLQETTGYAARVARYMLEEARFEGVLATLSNRDAADPSFEVRFMTAVALFSLGRRGELSAYCRSWMDRSPTEVIPAGIIVGAAPPRAEPDEDAAVPAAHVRLVQFWDAETVPPDIAAVMASWRRFHPSIRHEVFSETTARAFLRTHFDAQTVATFDTCHHAAMKADYFRIAFLYAVGGVYVDADERCDRAMDAILLAASRSEITAVRSSDIIGYLFNSFLGARAGSRIVKLALDEAASAIHRAEAEGRKPSIWETTGPGLITRAVARHLSGRPADAGEVFLLPFQQYRAFVHTDSDLEYKRLGDANWQLA